MSGLQSHFSNENFTSESLRLGGPWLLLGGLLGDPVAPWVASWCTLSDLLGVLARVCGVSWRAFWGSCRPGVALWGSECLPGAPGAGLPGPLSIQRISNSSLFGISRWDNSL